MTNDEADADDRVDGLNRAYPSEEGSDARLSHEAKARITESRLEAPDEDLPAIVEEQDG